MPTPPQKTDLLNIENPIQVTPPNLIWSKCDTSDYTSFEIVESSNFPFKRLCDIKTSIANSQSHFSNKGKYILDHYFMKILCHAESVVIIQENFDDSHWITMYSYFKNIPSDSKGRKPGINIKEFYIVSSKNITSLPAQITSTCKVIQIKKYFNNSKPQNSIGFHDRLVLLDNTIWHFGGSVCCMMDKPIAYSGPWYDYGNSLKNFIDSLNK